MNLREVGFDLPGIEKLQLAQEKKIELAEVILSSSALYNKRLETVKNLLREGMSLTNRLILLFKTDTSFRFQDSLKAFREILLSTKGDLDQNIIDDFKKRLQQSASEKQICKS